MICQNKEHRLYIYFIPIQESHKGTTPHRAALTPPSIPTKRMNHLNGKDGKASLSLSILSYRMIRNEMHFLQSGRTLEQTD